MGLEGVTLICEFSSGAMLMVLGGGSRVEVSRIMGEVAVDWKYYC